MKNTNLPDNADALLMEGVQKSDYVCYNKLFCRYYQPLCRYATNMLGDSDDAEDVIQDLFVRLWENRHKIRIAGSVSSYLYTMAKNSVLNHLRAANSYKMLLSHIDAPSCNEEENLLEQREFRAALRDCINRLPPQSKKILLMDRFSGFKQKEISDKLQISIQTVKNTIWRSLQILRRCMELKEAR